jgi:aryl-alcohol dehydrogenase
MKIAAAVVPTRSAPFEIETLDLAALLADEVPVRVVASGMCHTDLHARDGYFPNLPIVFSNGSRDGGSVVRDIGAVGCLRSLRAHEALDGVSWVQGGSVEIAVGQTTAATESAPSSVPSLGRRSARELGSTSFAASTARLRRFELGAVSQHGMHDDGQTTGERDPRLAHRRPFADCDDPVLELQRSLVARQHDVCGLIQECTHSCGFLKPR